MGIDINTILQRITKSNMGIDTLLALIRIPGIIQNQLDLKRQKVPGFILKAGMPFSYYGTQET